MSTRVLVRLPNWLGDVLLTRPLIAHLLASGAEVAAVGPAGAIELFREGFPALDLHVWPRDAAARAALARTLRSPAADAVYLLPVSFSSAWHARAWGARRSIGYAGDARSPLLDDARRRPPRGDLHLSEEYLALAHPRGTPAPRVARALAALPVAAAHREEAAATLAGHGVGGAPFAILAPGAIYGPAKRWSPERFTRVAASLRARGLAVLLAGDARDREITATIAAAVPGAIDLAGRTSLGAAAGLAARAHAVLSNDSGFAHLAAAVGAPTVVIFGSTSSAWTAPLGPRVRVVQKAPVCSPCFQRTCAIGYACLAAVEPAAVERALAEVAA